MKREQTLQAIARIEAALTRLETAGPRAIPAPDADLFNRHESLRASVEATLAELDTLIGTLEK